jgi:VWFA-related protein
VYYIEYAPSWHAKCVPAVRMSTPRALLPAALLALLFPSVSHGQQVPSAGPSPGQAPRATASVELSLFNLDVVVTDSKGNAVHGLTAADFEVRHAGKVVEVTNFTEIRAASTIAPESPSDRPASASPSAAPASPRPPRHLVLFLDRLYLPEPQTRKETFDSLRSLLRTTLAEGDEAMIVTWNRSIRTVLPFTDHLDSLEQSLARIERESARIEPEQAEIELIQSENAWFESLADDPRIGSGAGGGTLTDKVAARQAYFEMKAKTAALRGLAATLGGADGRKVLVLVTHRFSRRPGLEFTSDTTDARRLLEEVVESANANGVTLYTLFPRGFDTPMPSAVYSAGFAGGSSSTGGLLQNEMEALDFVASRTGGIALAGPGNAPRFVERVSRDLASWYSLGYPSRAGAGRVAPVGVRMKDRSLRARVRSALVEKSLEEQMADRVLAHLFRPDERAHIPISATASVSLAKGKYRVRLEVKIPIGSLVLLPSAKGAEGTFSVFVAAVARDGDFSTVSRRSQPFEIPETDLETAKAGHYAYVLDIETAGPEARVCVGIWDENANEAGFALVTPSRS